MIVSNKGIYKHLDHIRRYIWFEPLCLTNRSELIFNVSTRSTIYIFWGFTKKTHMHITYINHMIVSIDTPKNRARFIAKPDKRGKNNHITAHRQKHIL